MTSSRKTPGRLRRASAAALLSAAVLPVLLGPAAGPAVAHGGPIALELRGDGGLGVEILATFKSDGDPVDEPLEMTASAVSEAGDRRFGPVPVVATGEGRSFYRLQQPLPEGAWTLTVMATEPQHVMATAVIHAHPPKTGDGSRPVAAHEPEGIQAAESGADGWGTGTWLALAAVPVFAVGAFAAQKSVRRSRTG